MRLQVIVRDDKFAGEVHSSALPRKEERLVHQARQPVLRDEVLYILLLAQPGKRDLELFVLFQLPLTV